MRYSRMLGRSLRDAPAGSDTTSAALLARAGFVRQLGAGIYTYLPLAWRSILKIEAIIREEMERIDCHELSMPVVQPADLWKETGRWSKIGDELVRLEDRAGRDMVLAMTHEEVATDLVRHDIRSYRQLPVAFFQIQTKFRDEPRPRAGILRGREFLMKDAYSFHVDREDHQRFYNACHRAYLRAFARCGIAVLVVESAGGIMGGEGSHEFMLEAPAGEDVLFVCPNGDYSANREVAATTLHWEDEPLLPLEEVATPDAKTIEAVAGYLGVPTARTLKAVFYDADGQFVFVGIRGDRQVNEMKLALLLEAKELKPATEAQIRAAGAEPGYASPIGVHGALVVSDLSATAPNLVGGANRAGYHLRNVNLERDYRADHVADIGMVQAGDRCPVCGAELEERRGIEVGNIFKLGYDYSKPLGCTFLDEAGEEHPMVMGSYGFGVSRMLASVAEASNDERGLRWPVSIAPFHVHLVVLGGDATVRAAADAFYELLTDSGVEVLYDDRDESAGVKFADADLLGVPLRAAVSARSLKGGGVELKAREAGPETAVTLPPQTAIQEIQTRLREMQRRLLDAADDAASHAPA